MYIWTKDSIRFLKEASEKLKFNRVLAQHAAKYLEPGSSVLEGGCGLGYLSMELVKSGYTVTSVDLSADALTVLRENIAVQGYGPSVLETDVFSLPKEMIFDHGVFCFFGGTEELLCCVKQHCKKGAVLFKKNWNAHRFTLNESCFKKYSYSATCAELNEMDIPYRTELFPLDMGQPFHSLKDAVLFFQVYSKNGDTISEDKVLSRLQKTEDPLFPYYLPAERSVGLIYINCGDIPDIKNQNKRGKK